MKLAPLAGLFLFVACTKESAPPSEPPPSKPAVAMPDWKAAFQHQVRYDPAKSAVVVSVTLLPGFHAYTTGEQIGKPLELLLTEDSAYELDGAVTYPAGTTKELPIGKSVIVEGSAEVVAKVKPKPSGAGEAKGTFRYQVCTNEACDRPRTEPFSVAATPSS